MKQVKNFLARSDQFGSWAKFRYRQESGYGTRYGGLCSVVLFAMTFLFAAVQLFGWTYNPNYNQTTTVLYIPSA